MHNTTESYKEKVKCFPQNWRMKIKVILDVSEEDIILETEDGEHLETETAEILYFPAPGAITIPADDIFESGLSECAFLSSFTIGSSVRSNWWVRIFNEDGKYVNDVLAKAEFYPYAALLDDEENEIDIVPIGVYHTDKITIQDNDLHIACFDKMGYMEKPFVPLNTKRTLYEIASALALEVRATLLTTPQELSILSLTVDDSIFDGYSKKQVLELIATVCGSFAQFDNNGDLVFKWFFETDVELSGDYANKAISLNGNTFSLDGNVVKVTGVRVVNEDTELAMVGSDEYLITINENPIATLYPDDVANFVIERIKNTKYIPCEWNRIGGDPSLQLGDIITIIDNKEQFNEENYEQYDKYPLYMSGRNWTYNCGGFSDIYTASGNAEQDLNTDKGMTKSKRLAQLSKRITQMKNDLTEEMDSRQEFLLLFNETIAASMGFYTTCLEDNNGAIIQYMHDKPLLQDSGTIYTKGINGFAWTNNGWNDGNPVWEYGFDKNGNAILNQIYTYNLTADVIVSGLLKSKNGASWIDMDTGEFCFRSAEVVDASFGENGEDEYEYEYKKVLELTNRVLSVYGVLKSLNFPNLSVSIGKSENGNYGAFTVTDNADGYGDLLQIYQASSGEDNGVVLTFPFLINATKTNRKGMAAFSDVIRLFNDVGADSSGICEVALKEGKVLIDNGRVYVDFEDSYLCISNDENTNQWINWDAPKQGHTPSEFRIGDGTKGGYANIRANILKGNEVQIFSEQGGSKVAKINSSGYMWIPEIWIGAEEDVGYNECALSVIGGCVVDGFAISSDRKLKENIEEISVNALSKIAKLKFYSYDRKEKLKGRDPLHIKMGIMTDEAPDEILNGNGNAIDLYAYTSLLAKAVQELTELVQNQAKEIKELKEKLNENK